MERKYRLTLFGHPFLEGPKGEIALSPMQWALVALAFGHGGAGLSRGELVSLFWEAGDESMLLKRLSQLVYSLEQRVGAPLLLRSATAIRPDTARVETDIALFHAPAAHAQ